MRNPHCSRYDLCLTLAAQMNADGFNCEHCRYRRSYFRQKSDLIGSYMLAAAVFRPEIYKKYRGWKQGNTRLGIKRATRKRSNNADQLGVVTQSDIDELEEIYRIFKPDKWVYS